MNLKKVKDTLSSLGEQQATKLFEENKDVFTAWSQFKPSGKEGLIASDEGNGFDPNKQLTEFKTGTPPIDLARLCIWWEIKDRDDVIDFASRWLGDEWFNN